MRTFPVVLFLVNPHAPGNADYEDAESIASGYFISLTEFDQMILNS